MNESYTSQSVRLIVITGGPGAGKTAFLEMLKKLIDEKVVILPEAASIIYGGGFWRFPSLTAKKAAQRAIFHIQSEMENLVRDENKWDFGLCDRGTLDGLAYWPGDEKEFLEMSGTSIEREFSKYHAVIHLQTPSEKFGYNHFNPLRIETVMAAQEIDQKIGLVWHNHPRYHVIANDIDFLHKAETAIDLIKLYLPAARFK